ncbi:unnamed protein product [Closterium sp. Naga37s-1]|nr:unnamed protein product [Closterium sp. Naga37s-1]
MLRRLVSTCLNSTLLRFLLPFSFLLVHSLPVRPQLLPCGVFRPYLPATSPRLSLPSSLPPPLLSPSSPPLSLLPSSPSFQIPAFLLIGPTASFGSDTANFPLYSEVARWYASGVTAVLALIATKLLGRPILSPVPVYSFAGAGAAITITAVCIRELNGRIGIGATCMVYAVCTLSLLLWQSILSGAPMLVGSCSGSSPVAAVGWRRVHWLRLLGCLLAFLVAYSCWLWFPPASEAARVLLPSATPLYFWPPASMGVRYWWWIGPLAVPIFALLLFCSDGLVVALQERVYLQYDLPVTSLVLYVSTSALFVDFWDKHPCFLLPFAFSDHFDRAFGFVFDCPQCLLYLVLASVPSALAAFLTALLLRVSGGLVSSLVLRVSPPPSHCYYPLLLPPSAPFPPSPLPSLPLRPHPYLSAPIPSSLPPSLPLCPHPPLSAPIRPSLPPSAPLCPHPPLSAPIRPSLPPSAPLCPHPPLSAPIRPSLPPSAPLCPHPPLSAPIRPSLPPSAPLCPHPPLSAPIRPSLPPSLHLIFFPMQILSLLLLFPLDVGPCFSFLSPLPSLAFCPHLSLSSSAPCRS